VFAATDAELVARLKQRTAAGLSWPPASGSIGYAHRSVDGADVYFVANTANAPYEGRLEPGRKGAKAEVWDALTGRRQTFDGVIALPPYGSAVLVMGEGMGSAPAPRQGTGKELDLSGGWDVTFAGTARKVPMETLKSWTDDPATKFYSGVAVYVKEIRVGREMLGAELDFGMGQPLPPGPPRQAGMRAW
jgi:hypothetical protein